MGIIITSLDLEHADQTARLRERGRQPRGDGVWGPGSYQLQLLLGLGSNLNGVGKIGCLEVATMVIRAMILGSAACSNKYMCFDRSINLGTIPFHKVSECSLH
ncbi:hypothetical protein Peur_031139 [Populus x canadensis]